MKIRCRIPKLSALHVEETLRLKGMKAATVIGYDCPNTPPLMYDNVNNEITKTPKVRWIYKYLQL